jgi:hypothetical protein
MAIFEKALDEGTERVDQLDQIISDWTKVLEIDPGDALKNLGKH